MKNVLLYGALSFAGAFASPGAADTAAPAAVPIRSYEIKSNQRNQNVMQDAGPAVPAFPFVALKPGVARGYVKDTNGKALRGAKIGVRSTAMGGFYSGGQAQSDERGYYEINVPAGVASFYCAGITQDYGDGRAAFGLHPWDGEIGNFASARGVVENWLLLPYGIGNHDAVAVQPQYAGNYYGGSLTVGYWVADGDGRPVENLPVGAELTLTFTPTAPMLCGGQAPQFVIRRTVGPSDTNPFYLNNFPVTTYKLEAKITLNGKFEPLRIKETGPYARNEYGLNPKDSKGPTLVTFRPDGAKAEMATPAHGNWGSLSITLSR